MKKLSTLLLACSLVATAWAQTSNKVLLSFDHRAAGQPLVIDQTVFSIWNGKAMKLTRAEFYLAEISLRRPDNTSVTLAGQYVLANANSPEAKHDLGTWPVSVATGIDLHIGVPFDDNHADPATFKPEHPLSPKDPSMHWGWAAGYRFMAIEGFVDNNGDGIPEDEFEYHNLGDPLYTAVSLTGTTTAADGTLEMRITLDYARLFETLPMTGNLFMHGSDPVNKTMMANAAQQGFMKISGSSSAPLLEENAQRISASPNPFSSETLLRYDLPTSGPLALTVLNPLGQVMRRYAALPASGSLRVEKGELPDGLYYLCFSEEGQVLARKPIVMKQ